MKTSYFAMMRNFSQDVEPIAICAKVPPWYKGAVYKKIVPDYNILMEYKRTGNVETYTRKYNDFLSTLNVEDIVNDLRKISKGKEPILLCYEKSTDFCHRHLLSKWLNQNGIKCEEWKKN